MGPSSAFDFVFDAFRFVFMFSAEIRVAVEEPARLMYSNKTTEFMSDFMF